MFRPSTSSAVALAAALAACTGGGNGPSPQTGGSSAAIRGAITAVSSSSLTVNGVVLDTSGAAVRIDGAGADTSSLHEGMVVTVRGKLQGRSGEATEIDFEHGIEGQVDDKGVDVVSVGGQRIHVDDSTEFGDPDRLASISVGSVIAVSGVPDDRGGLRASRIDRSPRATDADPANDDDLDAKGFVSGYVPGTGFQLRISPDAASYWAVTVSGVTLPAGFGDGAYVEAHALQPPTPPGEGAPAGLLGTIAASAIEVEDRFGEAEVEVEGIVSSGDSAAFVVDGVEVMTDAATAWQLGAPADLVPGVEVEAEGLIQDGMLHATKVSFRPGVRISAALQDVVWDPSTSTGTATILGVPVQLPSFAEYDVAPANGARVEVRGNPNAAGNGIVASRVKPYSSGGNDRVEVRAVVTAKASAAAGPTFDVLGLTLVTNTVSTDDVPDTELHDAAGAPLTAAQLDAAVEAGHTVVNARAASAADLVGTQLLVEQVELEGTDG
jgi:hypothetical protein